MSTRRIEATHVHVPAGPEFPETPERGLYEANSFFFQPIEESVRDMEARLHPEGQQVLTVAAYGGYPSFFLAGDAERVVAFDVDPRQIGWNLILREGLRHFDYDSGSAYLSHEAGADERAAMRMTMLETVPAEQRAAAEAMAITYETVMGFLARQAAELYPHVRDRQAWDTARTRVRDGGWEIHRAELVELTERLARDEGENRFDTFYISSIRNWTLYHRWMFDYDRTEKFEAYDTRLAGSAQTLLRDDGTICEVLVDDGPISGFPKVPIEPERYPGFTVTRHPSVAGLRTEIVVARR